MCGNEFRLSNTKGNAFVFPFPSPKARASYKRIAFFGCVLYHSIVARSHQWKIATHMSVYTLHHAEIEWFIFTVAKDHPAQLGNILCILSSRPTLKKPPT